MSTNSTTPATYGGYINGLSYFGQSIFDYSASSNGAEDYEQLAREVLEGGDPSTYMAETATAGSMANFID